MNEIISLRQIISLIEDVFNKNQKDVAECILLISSSQLSNAINGERYINSTLIDMMFAHEDMVISADKGKLERPNAKARIIKYLKAKGIFYPDIEKASEGSYTDFVTAIVNHYPPDGEKEKKPKSYEEAIGKGDESSKKGNWKKALEHYMFAEALTSGNRVKEIEVCQNIAQMHLENGDYFDAITFYKRALGVCRILNGENHLSTAELHQRIGVVYRKDSQYDKADESFKSAEKILEGRLGKNPEDDARIANLYNDFGLKALNEKDFESARYYYEKSYIIREKNYRLAIDHNSDNNSYVWEFAFSIHNMGTYHNKIVTDRIVPLSDAEKTEHLMQAAKDHERAYEMRNGLLRGKDPLKAAKQQDDFTVKLIREMARTLVQWASDLAELGDPESALQKVEQGTKIREGIYGKGVENQDAAWSFFTLGLVYDKLNNTQKALEYYSESYRIRVNVKNADHPYAAKALFQIGRLKASSSPKEALIDLGLAYDIQKRFLREGDPELSDTMDLINKLNKFDLHLHSF